MKSDNNQRIVKNTLLLYFRTFVTIIIGLYTSRIVLKALGVEDFGIYNVVGGIVSMLGFLSGALGAASSRFITFEIGNGDLKSQKETFRTAFTVHFILALVAVLFAETIGLWFLNSKMTIPENRLFAANIIFQLSIIGTAISLIQIPINALIIAHERISVYAYQTIFDTIMRLVIAYIITVILFDHLIVYGILLLLVQLLIIIFFHFYSLKNFKEYSIKFNFEKTKLVSMISFSGWSLIGSLAYLFKFQGINIVLNLFFGPIVNTAFGIANQISDKVNIFVQNFTVALNPQITKSYAANDVDRTMFLMYSGAKFSFYLLLFFAIPILLETRYLLDLWLGIVPEYTVVFTRLIIINALLETFSFSTGAYVQATGKIKWYQIIIGGVLMANIPLSYLFLKLGFQPWVTMIIAIILTAFTLIARLFILKNLIPKFLIIQFANKVYMNCFFVAVIATLIPLILSNSLNVNFSRFIVVIIVSIFSTFISIWFIGLKENEKYFFKNQLNRVFMKFGLSKYYKIKI